MKQEAYTSPSASVGTSHELAAVGDITSVMVVTVRTNGEARHGFLTRMHGFFSIKFYPCILSFRVVLMGDGERFL